MFVRASLTLKSDYPSKFSGKSAHRQFTIGTSDTSEKCLYTEQDIVVAIAMIVLQSDRPILS